jgi:hypothetical protein
MLGLESGQFAIFSVDPERASRTVGRMQRLTGLILGLVLSACSAESGEVLDRPREVAVDQLEARLAAMACVGNVENWERRYALWDDQGRLPRALVLFQLRRVPPGESGWRIRHWGRQGVPIIDDSPGDIAIGRYDPSTLHLSIEYCGPNHF